MTPARKFATLRRRIAEIYDDRRTAWATIAAHAIRHGRAFVRFEGA